MGKSTISMVIFNRYVTNYQRVRSSNFGYLLGGVLTKIAIDISHKIWNMDGYG
jgi:hypothetical protein